MFPKKSGATAKPFGAPAIDGKKACVAARLRNGGVNQLLTKFHGFAFICQ